MIEKSRKWLKKVGKGRKRSKKVGKGYKGRKRSNKVGIVRKCGLKTFKWVVIEINSLFICILFF
jgi:hypothetical protein